MSNLEVLHGWYKPWSNNEFWRKIYDDYPNVHGYLHPNRVELESDYIYNTKEGQAVHYISGKDDMTDISYQIVFNGCFNYMQKLYEDTYRGKDLTFAKVEDIMKHVDDFMVRADKLKAFI
jgi:hypothetical protein